MQEIAYEGKKTKHYVLHINLEMSLSDLQKKALIDPVKAAMLLPPIEDEKKDLIYESNETINPENKGNGESVDGEIVDEKPTKETMSLIQTIAEKAESLIDDPDSFKLWRVDNGLAENLKQASEFDKSKVLNKLKELEKAKANV